MKFGIRVLDKQLSGKLQFREYLLLGSHTVHSNLTGLLPAFSSFVTDSGGSLCGVSGRQTLRQRTLVCFTKMGAGYAVL